VRICISSLWLLSIFHDEVCELLVHFAPAKDNTLGYRIVIIRIVLDEKWSPFLHGFVDTTNDILWFSHFRRHGLHYFSIYSSLLTYYCHFVFVYPHLREKVYHPAALLHRHTLIIYSSFVDLSRGVFHSCLKTFLFSESLHSRLSLPQADLL